MSGFPIEKSKEAMRKLIDGMRPSDTFNVVRFAGDTGTLWSRPKAKTSATAREALRYVEGFRGGGGTEMRKGIIEALGQPAEEGRLRIAFLLTDGYVGDEVRILQAIEKERRGARVFTLGVGSSVNRYLLDRAAEIGLGEAFYVRQDEDSKEVIERFFQRVDRPALAHIIGALGFTRIVVLFIPKAQRVAAADGALDGCNAIILIQQYLIKTQRGRAQRCSRVNCSRDLARAVGNFMSDQS